MTFYGRSSYSLILISFLSYSIKNVISRTERVKWNYSSNLNDIDDIPFLPGLPYCSIQSCPVWSWLFIYLGQLSDFPAHLNIDFCWTCRYAPVQIGHSLWLSPACLLMWRHRLAQGVEAELKRSTNCYCFLYLSPPCLVHLYGSTLLRLYPPYSCFYFVIVFPRHITQMTQL